MIRYLRETGGFYLAPGATILSFSTAGEVRACKLSLSCVPLLRFPCLSHHMTPLKENPPPLPFRPALLHLNPSENPK